MTIVINMVMIMSFRNRIFQTTRNIDFRIVVFEHK